MEKSCWDAGCILKEEPTRLADGLDLGGDEENRGVKDNTKVFGLSNWVKNDAID